MAGRLSLCHKCGSRPDFALSASFRTVDEVGSRPDHVGITDVSRETPPTLAAPSAGVCPWQVRGSPDPAPISRSGRSARMTHQPARWVQNGSQRRHAEPARRQKSGRAQSCQEGGRARLLVPRRCRLLRGVGEAGARRARDGGTEPTGAATTAGVRSPSPTPRTSIAGSRFRKDRPHQHGQPWPRPCGAGS
jgi:hypothetical protein